MFKSMTSKAAVAVAALAAAGTMAIPNAASAQSYYGYNDRYYGDQYAYRGDDCRYRDSRTAGGAVIGGTLGAVAGSQLAARGRRTEGSILGGVLGAVVGGSVGNNSTRYCSDYDSRYRYSGDRDYYGYDNGYRYDDRYRYSDRYDDRYYGGYQSSYPSYSYGSRGNDYGYGCQRVESQTRDRYGRLVTTYREVC